MRTKKYHHCLVEGCDKKPRNKGHCQNHHRRIVLGIKERVFCSGICTYKDCNKPQQQNKMCDNHSRAVREAKKITDFELDHLKCKIEGCNTRISAKGFCRPHYVKEINSKKTGPRKSNRTKKNFLVDFTDNSLEGKSYSGVWFKRNSNYIPN